MMSSFKITLDSADTNSEMVMDSEYTIMEDTTCGSVFSFDPNFASGVAIKLEIYNAQDDKNTEEAKCFYSIRIDNAAGTATYTNNFKFMDSAVVNLAASFAVVTVLSFL